MADVFIDCEWIGGDYLTILGAYSLGQSRFQLFGKTLTRRRLSRFLNLCCGRNRSRDILLFCHGPDLGRIRREFDLELKEEYYCINTITAFRRFTNFRDVSLGHLERYFGLSRKYAPSTSEMNAMWNSRKRKDRQVVLNYNWEDCINLWHLVNVLKRDYGLTRGGFKQVAMDP